MDAAAKQPPSMQSYTINGTRAFFSQNDAHRVNTSASFAKAITAQYPSLHLSIVSTYAVNLEAYAAEGNATMTALEDEVKNMPTSLYKKYYAPPARRSDGGTGSLAASCSFGKFHYNWQDHDFIMYQAETFAEPYGAAVEFFLLGPDELTSNALLRAAGLWNSQIRGVVLVFDGGFWTRSRELYESVMRASWDAVILDKDMKKALIDDHVSFFRSQDTYKRLQVPWKRGVIYHGPPGNGKTISIKATMHMLYDEKPEVPTLYVRSLKSFYGPEDSIKKIFSQARQLAPCYLVFEDLDSIVSDGIRSYFLNEVDGLKENDGIFMVGSTNHLERLDPGISKRPSRFDRKYFFPNPDYKERVAYCKFWQGKLKKNKEIDFPDALCIAVAKITDKFSFAYIQEAFVAALLAIARVGSDDDSLAETMGVLTVDLKDDWIGVIDGSKDGDDSLEDNVLWAEIQKQIEILRQGLDETPEE